jgi:glutaredoxin
VYALSTCGFCKRALQFLKEQDIEHRYVYVDRMPYEDKQEIKAKLAGDSGKRVAFPFLVVDGDTYLVGFVEDEWRSTLGV